MNYIQLKIEVSNEAMQELVIALLADNGYNGFETTLTNVLAYIDEIEYSESLVKKILQPMQIKFIATVIEKQNWNEIWETNFPSVLVDNFVGIRANFHQALHNVQHEIIITPKMSFGTGHHETTFSVIQLMQEIDFNNKTVFDFGTGTGILAILAEKLGAKKVVAVDNDEWCIENSIENVNANNCKNIIVQNAENAITNQKYDIVIANLNKNIILQNIQALHNAVKNNGFILLSGLLKDDEDEIKMVTSQIGWQPIKTIAKNNWIALCYTS